MDANTAAVMGEVKKALASGSRSRSADMQKAISKSVEEMARDFIDILYQCIEESKDEIATRTHRFRVVAQVGNITYSGDEANCEINIDHGVETTSWLPELYDYALDLVILMNNGYSAKNVLYIWDDHGKLTDRSRQWYGGAHFIQRAVRNFNDKYAGTASADYDRNMYT